MKTGSIPVPASSVSLTDPISAPRNGNAALARDAGVFAAGVVRRFAFAVDLQGCNMIKVKIILAALGDTGARDGADRGEKGG